MMLLLASLLGQALAQPANRTGDDYACEGGVCVRQVGGPYTSLDQCLNDGSCGTPPPPPSRDRPAACDLQFAPDGVTRGCSCDGYDLSQAKGQVLRTAADAAGYTIIFSLCTEIPAAAIPRGCKSFVEKPAALRFHHADPSDCHQIGSLGPCDLGEDGPCGMFGVYDAGSGYGTETLNLELRYPFGCNNTLTLTLQHGVELTPSSPATSSPGACDYGVQWPALPLQPAPVQPRGFNVPKVRLPWPMPRSYGLQKPGEAR
jgi:hypothetical protein